MPERRRVIPARNAANSPVGLAGVVHALLVRGELHREQVPVPDVPGLVSTARCGIR